MCEVSLQKLCTKNLRTIHKNNRFDSGATFCTKTRQSPALQGLKPFASSPTTIQMLHRA